MLHGLSTHFILKKSSKEVGKFEIRAAKEERIRREKQAQIENEKLLLRQHQHQQQVEHIMEPDIPLSRHARKRLNRKAAKAAEEEVIVEEEAPPTPTLTLEDQVTAKNKQIKSFKKKLRQIDELKVKKENGTDLNEDQISKLDAEMMLISNLAEAELALQALSLSANDE